MHWIRIIIVWCNFLGPKIFILNRLDSTKTTIKTHKEFLMFAYKVRKQQKSVKMALEKQPYICFTMQPFFGKAPSSFVTERKDNITFGKYSFSLRFLLFHFCFFLLPSCSLFCSLFYSWISTMFWGYSNTLVTPGSALSSTWNGKK